MRSFRDDDEWDDSDDTPIEDDDIESDDDEPTIPCPHCRREIHEDAQRCPYCEQYVSTRKPWWIVIGAVVCLWVVFRWIVG